MLEKPQPRGPRLTQHLSPCVSPGGLGAVRRRLRRVVPPSVRGCVVRDGRERGLHLHGLLAQGGRRGRGRGRRGDYGGGGGGGGERGGAVDVHVQRAKPAPVGRRLVVPLVLHRSSQPSNFTSAAAARASARQLAITQQARTEFEHCTSHKKHNTKPVPRLVFQPANL